MIMRIELHEPPTMPTDHEAKESRQREILALLGGERLTSQLEIVERLHERGLAATQSSVSRDLKEMGVGWIDGRYTLPPTEKMEKTDAGFSTIAGFLRGVKTAGPHLTVVLTLAGAAQSVGVALDHAGWPEVTGTLAGDDTVFTAHAHPRDQQRFVQRLESYLPES